MGVWSIRKKLENLEEKARQEKTPEGILEVGGPVRGVRTSTRSASTTRVTRAEPQLRPFSLEGVPPAEESDSVFVSTAPWRRPLYRKWQSIVPKSDNVPHVNRQQSLRPREEVGRSCASRKYSEEKVNW